MSQTPSQAIMSIAELATRIRAFLQGSSTDAIDVGDGGAEVPSLRKLVAEALVKFNIGTKFYPDAVTAQNDVTLAVNEYFSVKSNAEGCSVDIYRKNSTSASALIVSLPSVDAIAAETATRVAEVSMLQTAIRVWKNQPSTPVKGRFYWPNGTLETSVWGLQCVEVAPPLNATKVRYRGVLGAPAVNAIVFLKANRDFNGTVEVAGNDDNPSITCVADIPPDTAIVAGNGTRDKPLILDFLVPEGKTAASALAHWTPAPANPDLGALYWPDGSYGQGIFGEQNIRVVRPANAAKMRYTTTLTASTIKTLNFFKLDGTSFGNSGVAGNGNTPAVFGAEIDLDPVIHEIACNGDRGAPIGIDFLMVNEVAADDLAATAETLKIWERQTSDPTRGSYWSAADGTLVSGVWGQQCSSKIPIPDDVEEFLATGTISGNTGALALVQFWKADDTYLGCFCPSVTGTPAAYCDKLGKIPREARGGYIAITSVRFSEMRIEFKRVPVVSRVNIRGRQNKRILVIGTSREKGYLDNNYPEMIGANLGCPTNNGAVGGSRVRYGVRSLVSEADPLGVFGQDFAGVAYSLSQTSAEAEAFIANYASLRPQLINAPETLSDDEKAKIRSCSYEVKIIAPLLFGLYDVILWAPGYNDNYFSGFPLVSDIDTAGVGSTDKKTFLGAVNFVFDEIKKVTAVGKSDVEIIQVEDLENLSAPELSPVIKAQHIVRDTWCIPSFEMWRHLGITGHVVHSSGSWVAYNDGSGQFWWNPNGTGGDYAGNWLEAPDGRHFHLARDGTLYKRAARKLTPWLDEQLF